MSIDDVSNDTHRTDFSHSVNGAVEAVGTELKIVDVISFAENNTGRESAGTSKPALGTRTTISTNQSIGTTPNPKRG